MTFDRHIVPLIVSISILANYYFTNIPFLGFGIGIIAVILTMQLSIKYPNSTDKVLLRWTIIFLLFGLLSVIWAIRWRSSIMHLFKFAFPTFSISLCVSVYLRSTQNLKMLMTYIYCSIVLVMFFVLNNMDWFSYEVGTRLAGNWDDGDNALWNSNSVAVCMDIAIYFGFFVLWQPNSGRKWLRLLYVALTAVMVYLVILAGSRKGIILLVLPIFIYQLVHNRRFVGNLILVSIGVIGIYYALMKVEFLYDAIGFRVEDMINVVTGNTTGREDDSRRRLVMYGLGWFSERPFVGYGFNQFRVLSDMTPDFMGRNFYAHNNYVELLVDMGLIGFFIYYSLHVYIIRRLLQKKGEYRVWVIAIILSLLFLDVGSVSYYDIPQRVILVIALYLSRRQQLKNNNVNSIKTVYTKYHEAN